MARPKHRTRPGGTYFVTTNTWQRRELFRQPRAAKAVERALLGYREKGFFLLHAYVIMPDHLHVLLTPGKTTSLESAMQLIKGGSSHEIRARFPVWQPGFTEHEVRDNDDYERHVRYIERNSVEAGLAEEPSHYSFSSANKRGRLDPPLVASGAEARGGKRTPSAGLKPRPSADGVAAAPNGVSR